MVALYWPSDGGGSGVPHGDKVGHAVLFAAVAFTGRRAGVPWPLLAGALVAHAGLSELLQGTVLPGRQGDPWDVVADVVGTVLGLVAGGARGIGGGRRVVATRRRRLGERAAARGTRSHSAGRR